MLAIKHFPFCVGIVIWEIYSNGKTPYENTATEEVLGFVVSIWFINRSRSGKYTGRIQIRVLIAMAIGTEISIDVWKI